MESHMMIHLVTLAPLVAFSLGIPSATAEEKPVVSKRGGIPYDEMWAEEDVIAYLRLPMVTDWSSQTRLSIEDISKRIGTARSLAGYLPFEEQKDLFNISSSQVPAVSFRLSKESRPDILVSVYDYRAWNILCDKIPESIMEVFSLWNVIPEAYTVEAGENEYALTHTGVEVQKTYFFLKSHCIISLAAKAFKEPAANKAEEVAEIDKVVREIVSLIESRMGTERVDSHGTD